MSGPSGLQTFFGWVRTFVAHFLGKRNLEVYTARLDSVNLNKRPKIRVFSVSGENYRVPAWHEFETVIRDALTDTSEKDTTEIIRNLRNKITTGKGLKPDARRSLCFIRRIMKQEQATCTLVMHSEAVIAAILESNEYKNLAELSEVLQVGLVPEYEKFHSRLPRTLPTV
jgi:hypothetical protein